MNDGPQGHYFRSWWVNLAIVVFMVAGMVAQYSSLRTHVGDMEQANLDKFSRLDAEVVRMENDIRGLLLANVRVTSEIEHMSNMLEGLNNKVDEILRELRSQ